MHWRSFGGTAKLFLSLVCAICATSSLWALASESAASSASQSEAETILAETPPMGWNSWDAYGETASESDIKSNAAWMADHLKAYGWEYIVVDSGWFQRVYRRDAPAPRLRNLLGRRTLKPSSSSLALRLRVS